MTAKQILDSFSESLMQDERILSPQERDLLTSLLQNSKPVSNHNPEVQSAVTAAISRSVGETVAQRAFALLGTSIVEQILSRSGIQGGTTEARNLPIPKFDAPQPPSRPQPFAPQPPSSPQPPSNQPGHNPQRPNRPVDRMAGSLKTCRFSMGPNRINGALEMAWEF